MAQYNFLHSLQRIKMIKGFDSSGNALAYVPKPDEFIEDKILRVNATVMYIRLKTQHNSNGQNSINLDLALQSYMTEVTNICKSNDNCRDIVIAPDHIMVIYSTPKKVDVDTVIDDSARARSLAMVVNKIYKDVKIITFIGIDYGELLMSSCDSTNSIRSFVWTGQPITDSKEMADKDENGVISITTIIWNNIKQVNQRLFKHENIFEDNYTGDVVNIIMNNWVLSNS